MARVIATGPAPPSNAAMAGGHFGAEAGQAFSQQLMNEHERRRREKLLNPMREALLEQLGDDETRMSPTQLLIRTKAQDPRAFSEMMNDPAMFQHVAAIGEVMTPRQPEPESFSRVVSSDSDLNRRFGLGIPDGSNARVEFTRDPQTGAVMKADVVAGFGTPQTQVNIGAGETQFAKELAKLDAEDIQRVREDGADARGRLPSMAQARAALEGGAFTPGSFGNTRAALARMGDLLGVNVGLGDAATAEQMEAASDQLSLAAAERLSRATNMSLGLARNTVTSLSRTPEGNKLILDMLEREADLQIREERLVNEFLSEHGAVRSEDGRHLNQVRAQFQHENPVVTERMFRNMMRESEADRPSLKSMLRGAGEEVKLIRFAGEVDRMSTEQLRDYASQLDEDKWEQLPNNVRLKIMQRLQE